ncbi:Uncharacterised protein [uncultured archaeon]|nr:Uncharacterised protein [uncultured archaeon]
MDPQLLLLASIAAIMSTLAPLAWSIYKETRYVDENNVFWNGLTALLFGVSYFAVNLLPINESIRFSGGCLSIVYGVFLLYAFISKKPAFITDEEPASLLFSGKTNGSFQLALLIPLIFPYLPISLVPPTYDFAIVSIILFIAAWVGSFLFFDSRNN